VCLASPWRFWFLAGTGENALHTVERTTDVEGGAFVSSA
jgi:hypothetical protein